VKRSHPGSLAFEVVMKRDARVRDGAAEPAAPFPDTTGRAFRGAFHAIIPPVATTILGS